MTTCPLCTSSHHRPFFIKDIYPIVQCMQCEFLFVSPPPTQAALTAFYQREDYHQGDPIGYTDYFGQRTIHERDARRRLDQIEKLCFTKGKLQFLLTSCGLEVIKVNRNSPGAPRYPYPFQRFLNLLKAKVGHGLDRRTPFWWSFGLSWRVVEQLSRTWYQLRWWGNDLCKGLEVYARKPCS